MVEACSSLVRWVGVGNESVGQDWGGEWDKVEGLAERPMDAMTGSTKVTGTTGGRESVPGGTQERRKDGDIDCRDWLAGRSKREAS
jgi:hypothetical protein